MMTDLEKLTFLQPYANRFAQDLAEMSWRPQKQQLEFISFSLNELVESDVRYGDWSRDLSIDSRMHGLLDALEALKNVRNLIIHRSKTLTDDEMRDLIDRLYECGQYIDWQIDQAISILESNEQDF